MLWNAARASPAAGEYKEKVRAKEKKDCRLMNCLYNDASFAIADRLYTSIFA